MAAEKLRVLVVTQYFWPENMRINDMVRDFTARGHEVTVLTGLPNYPEGNVYQDYKASPEAFHPMRGHKLFACLWCPWQT